MGSTLSSGQQAVQKHIYEILLVLGKISGWASSLDLHILLYIAQLSLTTSSIY
jgi:hypothetical protein